MKPTSSRRQVPRFLKLHHSGSAGAAALIPMLNASPETSGIGASSTNDRMARSAPTFVLQANVLFMTPPSAKQLSQRMLTPGGVEAAEAAVLISETASGTKSAVRR